MKYIIFLDVDGVINCDSTQDTVCGGYVGIDDALVKNLEDLCDRFEDKVSIVLTTTWAEKWYRDFRDKEEQDEFANILDERLRKYKLHAIDKIADPISYYRGKYVYEYLNKHPEIEGYVILDDFDFDFLDYPEVASHWIQTTEAQGFHEGLIDFAEDIIKGKCNAFHKPHI